MAGVVLSAAPSKRYLLCKHMSDIAAMYSTTVYRFYGYLDMDEMFSSHLKWPKKSYVDFACFDFGLSAWIDHTQQELLLPADIQVFS